MTLQAIGVIGAGTMGSGIAQTCVHLLFAHAVWLLGVVLSADLAFQGAMALTFGLPLRANARAASSPTEP